jgi:CHASE2 domain-containing sensor protein
MAGGGTISPGVGAQDMRRTRNRLRRVVLVALFVLTFGAIDPFGGKHALEQASEDRFLNITSPFFVSRASASLPPATVAPPKIVVVVIDEDDLRALNYRGGLLGYRAHCEIINAIADLKPAALFLDFDFHPRHATGGPAPDVAKAQLSPSSGGASASTSDLPPDCTSDDSETGLSQYAAALRWANRTIRGDRPKDLNFVYVSYDDTLGDAMTGVPRVDLGVLRDAASPNTYTLIAKGANFPSPAWALFKTFCTPSNSLSLCGYADADAVGSVLRARRELTLETGRTPDPQFASLDLGRALGCAKPAREKGFGAHFAEAARLFFDQFFLHTNPGITDADLKPCLPIANMNLRHIESPDFGHDAQALIRGRIVMVGFHEDLSGDRYMSPVHGVIPAVFVHAIALDNLFTDGARALHPAFRITGHLDAGDILTAAWIALAAFVAFYVRDRLLSISAPSGGGAFVGALWWGIAAPAFISFISIFVLVACLWLFHWSPSTWLGGSTSIFVALTIVLAPEGLRKLAETMPMRPMPVRLLFTPLRAALSWASDTFDDDDSPAPAPPTPPPPTRPSPAKGAAK